LFGQTGKKGKATTQTKTKRLMRLRLPLTKPNKKKCGLVKTSVVSQTPKLKKDITGGGGKKAKPTKKTRAPGPFPKESKGKRPQNGGGGDQKKREMPTWVLEFTG